jgi:hypothetical protein
MTQFLPGSDEGGDEMSPEIRAELTEGEQR